MSSNHPDKHPPFLVQLDDGSEYAVDPEALAQDGTLLTHVRGNHYLLMRDGRSIPVLVEASDRRSIRLTHSNQSIDVKVSDHRDQLLAAWGADEGTAGKQSRVEAPMPGLVLKVLVEPGQAISKGDPLLVLEAMKMENDIKAPFDGIVSAVHVGTGEAVSKGAALVDFE